MNKKKFRKILKISLYSFAGMVCGLLGLLLFNIFFPNTEASNAFIVHEITLDNSRLINLLGDDKQSEYLPLQSNTDLAYQLNDFFYNFILSREADGLKQQKKTIEDLMVSAMDVIDDFDGKTLTDDDKRLYLAIYRLRKLDRKIVSELSQRDMHTETFFQQPASIPQGKGGWIIDFQKPESPELLRYYELFRNSQFIKDIMARINDLFLFDETYRVMFADSPDTAFPYNKATQSITIDYNQIAFLQTLYYSEIKTDREIDEHLSNIAGMVLLREFGYAFFDIYRIPFSGKHVNASDQLAVILVSEIFNYSWDEIQRKVMSYAKALFRLHEIVDSQFEDEETGELFLVMNGRAIPVSEIEGYFNLILNDNSGYAKLRGKQRFYSIISMLVGYKADAFSPYLVTSEYEQFQNPALVELDFLSPYNYLRASNYWYTVMMPYFRLP